MLKKRIIPLICLFVVAAAVVTGMVYFQNKQDPAGQEPVVYPSWKLKSMASEIWLSIVAVQKGKTTEDELFYEPKNKAVLMDVYGLTPKKDHIDVVFIELTDEKIEIFNKLFPYNCFEFYDKDSLITVFT